MIRKLDDGNDGIPYIPSKDELRARLSMAYVSHRLGIPLDREGRGHCPFHDDTDPSYYLWEGDDGIMRWWCQPCGFGGDIFDLIQRKQSVGFPESQAVAARMLADLPPGYEPPRIEPRIKPTVADWQSEVAAAQAAAKAEESNGKLSVWTRLVNSDTEITEAYRWDAYLRTTWGWGLDPLTGTIYMPHWTEDGTLTGCKTRLGVRKGSLPGSKYVALYGSWLGRRHSDVLLTEGESDAVVAGWLAAEESIAIDIFALPSGAARPPTPEQLGFLGRGGTLYLAFDPDAAGVNATRAWIKALNEEGHGDVRVCILPLDQDLRACGLSRGGLRRLLGRAKSPVGAPDDARIAAAPHGRGYYKTDADGIPHRFTNWTVDPVAKLSGSEDSGFDVTVHHRRQPRPGVILLADLGSVQALVKWANKNDLIFTGTDNDRKAIAELVEALGSVCPEIFHTTQVGIHDAPEFYEDAGKSVVYAGDTYVGKVPWRYSPGVRAADVADRLWLPSRKRNEEDTGAFYWPWLSAFLALSASEVTHPLLAWLVASARRPEVEEFPLLFIGGSSGVGKSTLAKLGTRLMGSKIEIDLAANTPFILLRTLAASRSLPIFVDEWTRLSKKETREQLQGIIPVLYTGGRAERGQADLSSTTYSMLAPVIVAGEDTFTLDRELDRTVVIQPSKAAQNVRALNYINLSPIERFGEGLHRWLAFEAKGLPPLGPAQPTRPEYNRAVLLAGWATLAAYLAHCAANGEDVPAIPTEPDLSCFEVESPGHERENVYETALHECAAMRSKEAAVWTDPDGRGTWIRPVQVCAIIDREKLDIQLPGRSRAMLAYLRERYEVESGPDGAGEHVVPPASFTPVRAHLVLGLNLNTEEATNA
jgi:energy-coupling factor transporter ATP-binding protein EcfA2